MDKQLMNLQEVCKYVGRSEETMRKAIRNKEIPCVKFRGGFVFSKLAIDLWVLGLNCEEIKERISSSITKEMISQVIQVGL